MTPQIPFMLASVTKPMTALAVMQLVEAGWINLDSPVRRYIPWFRVADEQASAQITVRHLLYHMRWPGHRLPLLVRATTAL